MTQEIKMWMTIFVQKSVISVPQSLGALLSICGVLTMAGYQALTRVYQSFPFEGRENITKVHVLR